MTSNPDAARDLAPERQLDPIAALCDRPDTVFSQRFVIAPLKRLEFEAYLYAYDEFERLWRMPEPPEPLGFVERRALQRLYMLGLALDAKCYVWGTLWLVIDRATRVELARLGFKGTPRNGVVEIAYTVRRSARNCGVMTEALRALCEWLRTRDDVDAVRAETTVKNLASQRVLEKSGFQRVGATKAYVRWRRELT